MTLVIPSHGIHSPESAIPSYVYILANRKNGALYIGVTANLAHRVYQHKQKLLPGFTAKYGINKLVYYETFDDIEFAIQREKQMKEWQRAWEIEKIRAANPDWQDLYETLNQ
ncbi:MAG: GIY-YIG nuclease family protein [Hyphomicrobium sp.]